MTVSRNGTVAKVAAVMLAMGAIHALAFAPIGIPLLSVLGLAALCALPNMHWRVAIVSAFCWGLSAFGIGAAWLYPAIGRTGIGSVPTHVVFVSTVVATACFPVTTVALLKVGLATPRARFLAFPLLSTLCEYVRVGALLGVPLLYGEAHVDSIIALMAPVTGVWGVGFLAAVLASSVAYCVRSRRRALGIAAGLFACVPLAPFTENTTTINPRDRVAVVQAHFPLDQKWDGLHLPAILGRYSSWSELAMHHAAEVIVWPEVAMPAPASRVVGLLQYVHDSALESRAAVLAGVLMPEAGTGYHYNTVLGLGGAVGRVDKVRLAPLGEAPPPLLRRLGIETAPSGFSVKAGRSAAAIRLNDRASAAVAICYEANDAALVRDRVRSLREQAGYLVIASDESWFSNTWATDQNLRIARMRAMESGIPVLRSSNAGISAVIDASGRVRASETKDRDGIVIAVISPRSAATPWIRWGASPLLWCVGVLLLMIWIVDLLVIRCGWPLPLPRAVIRMYPRLAVRSRQV